MYYVKFGDNNIQEQAMLSEEYPGEGWYPAAEDISGKLYRFHNGGASPMTKKMIEDYESELRKSSTIVEARIKRDRALMESDWTQLPTSPLSDAKKAEWETYRQALRDFPSVVENDLEAAFPAQP
jgi:hypothetical protein